MTFSSVPPELRALNQWVVWRSTIRSNPDGTTKVVKPPLRLDDPSRGAVPQDPTGWGSFEQALACLAANGSALSGIGLMLTRDDPFACVDVDDESKVAPDNMDLRRQFVAALLELGTYAETSPGGSGLHVWMRAQTGVGGKHRKEVGSEVYAWDTFMTVTGRALPGCAPGVRDCQGFIDMLGLGEEAPPVEVRDDHSKPTGLTDGELIARARAHVSWFPERWNGRAGCLPGEWYNTFVSLIGVLDQLTGSVDQIRRVVYDSPMVRESARSASGESRPAKARRTVLRVLSVVRQSNGGNRYFIEHGKAQWESVTNARAARLADAARTAEAEAEELAKRESQAKQQGNVNLKGSGGAAEVVRRFTELLPEDRLRLRVPPGKMGELVLAAMGASMVPYLKFALPSTLAAVAGLCARAYAPDTGGPLAMNYILVAPSSTGKGQSMRVWQRFVGQANDALPAVIKPVNRILTNSTASVQGIVPELMDVPCCAWFIEEASGQFNAMSSPKNVTDENLRNFYNELYDAGEHGQFYSPPRSVAGRNAGFAPVPKLCVSTYWTTTPEKFTLRDGDIRDGFASRVVFVHHDGPGGERVRAERVAGTLPPHLLHVVGALLSQAHMVDEAYKLNPATADQRVTRCDTRAVREMWWNLTLVCDGVNRDALEGRLPKVYQLISRLPVNALRLACHAAVVENCYAPVVTPEHLEWAYGYLLHNALTVLVAADEGEVGDGVSDEVLAAKRLWRELVKKGAMRGLPGVPQSKLLLYMGSHTPFRNHRDGRTRSAANTIRLMVEQDLFQESLGQSGGRGRPARYLLLNEEAASG